MAARSGSRVDAERADLAGPRPGWVHERPQPRCAQATEDVNALIADAARDLSGLSATHAAGRLGDAGQKLESLKHKLEELQRRRQ